MSLVKQLTGETAIYGLSSILGRLVNWVILTPYFTRTFSTQEYGIVSELYFYIAFLLVFFTYRFETAFFRFASRHESATEDRAHANTVFTTASLSIIGTTVLFTSILLALAPAIASWLQYPDRIDFVRIFILIIALDALAAIPFARLRMDKRPLRFAFIRIMAIGLNISLVFFFLEGCPWLIANGQEWASWIYVPERRVAYVFWANLLTSLVTLLWLLPLYRRLAWRFARDIWQRMLIYALPLVVAAAAGITNALIGTPLLKAWGPGTTSENLALGGLFAAGAKLAVLMSLFIQAFNYAAEPFFFRQAAASEDRQVYADVARGFALVGSLAFLGIMLYLDLIQYFLGEDFREGLGVLPILLLANFLLGLFYNFSIGFKLTDRTLYGGYIALLGAVVTLGINYFFIPSLTYYAPAWAALACYLVMVIIAYILVQRWWPVSYQLGRMAYYLMLALAIWGVSLAGADLTTQLWTRTLLHTVLLLLVVVILWFSERQWLLQIWGRKT
jgi:O-antigen/teichoic acid export membrane protein